MIVIVDYGMGNLGSIANMMKKIGVQATIASDPSSIASADKLILPGVGAFDSGMHKLSELGLLPALSRKVLEEKTPILGLCLGMQLFTRRSEEGSLPGLRWIEADTIRFKFDSSISLRVPHMGWNTVRPLRANLIVDNLSEDPRYYFVHSYHVKCDDEGDVLATTRYGYEFPSIIMRGNIVGTQFHPEKSHKFGMQLLRAFVERL